MDSEQFERIAQEVLDSLPDMFQQKMENVHIVVEDLPSDETVRKMRLSSQSLLLGLYEGIPLTQRGTFYGTAATLPDKITLYKKNIERVARSETVLREKIREVLIHEIAHYYGMTEEQVRNAGY
ncbi:MAG: metallopeptidase family protein [Ignavibacteriae bacterium]|nr:metallopeptidase family protein [Ignavibacteriota bacterium]